MMAATKKKAMMPPATYRPVIFAIHMRSLSVVGAMRDGDDCGDGGSISSAILSLAKVLIDEIAQSRTIVVGGRVDDRILGLAVPCLQLSVGSLICPLLPCDLGHLSVGSTEETQIELLLTEIDP